MHDMSYDEKAPLYVPSISMGPVFETMLKEPEYRFFQKDTGAPFYYPAILLSAAYMMDTDPGQVRELCTNAQFIVGDSGGYQLATKAMDYSPRFRERVFEWLEEYATLALSLDWPPIPTGEQVAVSAEHFQKCLRISVENNEYFAKNTKGKTQYLTVLQGREISDLETWYEATKDFPFAGWSIGGVVGFDGVLQALALLLEKGALEKAKYFHVLGFGAAYAHVVSYLQTKLYDRGLKTRITYDASTPAVSSAYGLYWRSTRRGMFGFHVGRKAESKAGKKVTRLRCSCPVCEKWEMLPLGGKSAKSISYARLGLHNVYQDLLHVIDTWEFVSGVDDFLFKRTLRERDKVLFQLIDSMFESGLKVFRNYHRISMPKKAKNIFSLVKEGGSGEDT